MAKIKRKVKRNLFIFLLLITTLFLFSYYGYNYFFKSNDEQPKIKLPIKK